MKNDKLFWSTIDNNYAKTVDSSSDLKKAITLAIQKATEDNTSLNLTIVHCS